MSKRMAIYGRSGSGKSFYLKNLLSGLDRVIVFDPEEEYGEEKGFCEVSTLEDVYDILHDCWDSTFKIAYVPKAGQEIKALSELAKLAELVGEAFKIGKTTKPFFFVVDELHLSFPLSVNTVEYRGFTMLCRRGRKRGINLIGATQRPSEVHNSFRGNIDRVATFALAQELDLKAAAKATGDQLLNLLPNCPEFAHVFYENGDFTVFDKNMKTINPL